MQHHLQKLYSTYQAEDFERRLTELAQRFPQENPKLAEEPRGLTADQSEVLLIAYGDQVASEGKTPLGSLKEFMNERLTGVTCLHLLPNLPYSSDDGFSVIAHRQVAPALGSWSDVEALAEDYSLMFGAVVSYKVAHS